MKKEYGLSISTPNEEVFSCGLFSCIEYCKLYLNESINLDTIAAEVTILKEYSQKYNVAIRSFHLPANINELFHFEPSSPDESIREATFEMHKKVLDLVIPLGIELVVIHGSLRTTAEERPARLDGLVKYLQMLCDYLKDYNIKVALETLLPSCIGNGLTEHLYIMEHAQRDNLGICFDSNHMLEEDNVNFLQHAGQYVITTHLSDFDGVYERHWFPGRGVNDWKQIVKVMAEKGYDGPYVFEVSFKEIPAVRESFQTLISEWEALFA